MRAFGHPKTGTGMMQLGFLALPILLSACGNTLSDSSSNDDPTEDAAAAAASLSAGISWNASDSAKTGMASPGGSIQMYTLQSSGAEAFFPTCFDNNRTCRRAAATVITGVGSAPVVVQGFQLNFTYANKSGVGNAQWSNVVIDSASVTTAKLEFDATSGALSFGEATTRQLVSGATCALSSANAVGYASTSASPKILVGVRFVEEATKLESTSNGYSNGHLTAGRVWHSGILGVIGTTLRFKFVPDSDALTNDFGLDNFTEGGSSGIVVSPKFTADSSISGYKNHVILGYCLEGRKVGSSTRPLLYYSEAYLRTPKLQKLQ